MTGPQESQGTPDVSTDEHTDGERAEAEQDTGEPDGARDDDSPVERYRDSPGMGMFDDDVEPPEPNEPA